MADQGGGGISNLHHSLENLTSGLRVCVSLAGWKRLRTFRPASGRLYAKKEPSRLCFAFRSDAALAYSSPRPVGSQKSCHRDSPAAGWSDLHHEVWSASGAGLHRLDDPCALLSDGDLSAKPSRPGGDQNKLAGNEVRHAEQRRRGHAHYGAVEGRGHAQGRHDYLS